MRVVLAQSRVHTPCPLEQVILVPTSQVQMLGVPLGSDGFVSEYVEGKLLSNAVKVMSKLAAFEDPQAAMYLLRLSYGIVRANHFMRTTPLPQWSQVAGKFDQCVRDAVAQILGTTFPGDSYDQACVSTKVGGLGVRRVVDHAVGAFSASWHEASAPCREKWAPPDVCARPPASECFFCLSGSRCLGCSSLAPEARRPTTPSFGRPSRQCLGLFASCCRG